MTRTTVFGISLDAHDAAKVAQFWAATLSDVKLLTARTRTTPLSSRVTS